MSTLVDAMRSMDVSRISRIPVSRATGLCTHTFPFPFHVFSYLYEYGLLTRLRLLVCSACSFYDLPTHTLTFLTYAFLPLYCRLIYAYLLQLVDLSGNSLFLNYDLFTTHFPFTNICNCISQYTIYTVGDEDLFPIFNLLCNHPKGVTCKIP